MFAITDKSGTKTTLLHDINNLFLEYNKLIKYYQITETFEDIIKQIDDFGYYQFNLNNKIYYIINTSLQDDIISNFGNINLSKN